MTGWLAEQTGEAWCPTPEEDIYWSSVGEIECAICYTTWLPTDDDPVCPVCDHDPNEKEQG